MWHWDGLDPIIFTLPCKNIVRPALMWAEKSHIRYSTRKAISLYNASLLQQSFSQQIKELGELYQCCNAPSEAFLSGNGGGSEGLCTVSYQIYSSCTGILLTDRFWIRHLPKSLESHFSHRCFTGEQTPFDSKIGNPRSCNCSGSYWGNVLKLQPAILIPPSNSPSHVG